MRILAGFIAIFAVQAAPFQASFDANAKWEAVHGLATRDGQTQHEQHASIRVEAGRDTEAYIRSTPVTLSVGKRYQLAGWVRTENLQVRDLDRTPIARPSQWRRCRSTYIRSHSAGRVIGRE